MAQETITRSATASITANGTSTATGSISWSVPSLPEGVVAWDSVRISGSWSWTGKGNIQSLTINGTNTSGGVPFDIALSKTQTTPMSIQCRGNKNATGSNFSWQGLTVTYTYTAVGGDVLSIKVGGTWREVNSVYVKRGGVWVKQDDITTVFDTNKKYRYVEL